MSRVAVITPTIKPRSVSVSYAAKSVAEQTYQGEVLHFIIQDKNKKGPAATINSIADTVISWRPEYVMVLDDDDLLMPSHIEQAISNFTSCPELDVVGAYCKVAGRPFKQYNKPFSDLELMIRSTVPHTAVYKTHWLERYRYSEVQGFDWEWWKLLVRNKAKVYIDSEPSWIYRLDGGNLSQGEDPWQVEK